MQAWREWTAGAGHRHHLLPDHAAPAAAGAARVPARPRVVVIDGAVVEDAARAAELLAPLRALGPEMDTFADMPPVGLSYIHMDPPEPMPGMSDTVMLDALSPEAVDAIVDVAGPGSGSPIADGRAAPHRRRARALRGRRAEPLRRRVPVLRRRLPMDPAVVAALEAQFALVGAAIAPHKRAASTSTSPSAPRTRSRSTARSATPAAAHQGRGRPAGDLPRQPRDPRRLVSQAQAGAGAPPARMRAGPAALRLHRGRRALATRRRGGRALGAEARLRAHEQLVVGAGRRSSTAGIVRTR